MGDRSVRISKTRAARQRFAELQVHPALVMMAATVMFAALVWGVLQIAIAGGDIASALLLPIVAGAVVLLVFSPSRSFVYQCLAIPLVVTLNRHAGPWGPGRMAVYFFLIISLVTAGLVALHERGQRDGKSAGLTPTGLAPAGLAFGLMVVYLVGHVLGAGDRASAFEAFVNHVYNWPFLILPAVLLRRRWQVRVILWFVVGLGTILALASVVVTLFMKNPIAMLAHGGHYERVHLYFGSANTLALFLTIAFFVLLYAISTKSRRPSGRLRSLLKLGALFVILVAIIFTFSRRAWLATGLLLVVHVVWRRDWRGLILIVLVGSALSYSMLRQVGERARTITDMDAASNVDRRREIDERLRMLFGDGLSLTGWGLDRLTYAAQSTYTRTLYFHNYYLSLYYVTGIIGVLIYFGLISLVLRGLWKTRRLARSPDTRGIAVAGIAVILVVVLTGLFGMGNVTFPVNYFSALIPGLAFAALRMEPPDSADLASAE